MQVFQAAARQGHFRLTIHSNPESGTLECGMHAFTVGAAVVCFMRWVTEVRKRLMGGPAQGGGDCLGPGGPLRQRLALIVNRGKPSREAAYPAIKAAISAILLASKAPLACVRSSYGFADSPCIGSLADMGVYICFCLEASSICINFLR